ncbi:class I SAM-dependent methyltransferase [Allonocardiopsis opalescens]|uniref:Phosphatidylethanolamine N-methyltransferase /phosphatidyl-N-methylethanolamine N-methyltransferase n=1 Tax=Allonocardiopsis opalescens TaxID=1144618 RepID=A0A2T0Q5R3_9ACTN|nr:class I SAM-dependent methyltransferase [Allonocardiopsis opalescens]PRX99051.1 phosphatidylethanolamine N-methyltransferase /phosphatidyl-N-methylethanolamine N-methyltransferase [Allonocardiopsis opalescens]
MTETRPTDDATARARRQWDRMSAGYDRNARMEHWLIGDARARLCRRAAGRTLDVAVGTGLNLPHYPEGAAVTGVDLSGGMLAQARRRAAALDRPVELREADAQRLPFADASFDTVLCTLALCAIPDQAAAIGEMYRVLRPGGRLLLIDHVEYAHPPMRWLEPARARRGGRPVRRRPLRLAAERGFAVDRHRRLALGLVDEVVAHRPQHGG